jgi:hypothetical protein
VVLIDDKGVRMRFAIRDMRIVFRKIVMLMRHHLVLMVGMPDPFAQYPRCPSEQA